MSSLVTCPICNKSVPNWYIEDHLDRECQGASNIKTSASLTPKSDKADTTHANKRQSPALPLAKDAKQRRTFGSFAAGQQSQKSTQPRDAATTSPATTITTIASHEPGLTKRCVEEDAAINNDMSIANTRTLGNNPRDKDEKVLHNKGLPLAERLRPLTLDTFEGQSDLVGKDGILRKIIESDVIPSMIFWGGPGLGKTTLARIIARRTNAVFKEMSAVSHKTTDVKQIIDEAGNLARLAKKRTILFLDEIHRFNRMQQDTFLPYIERGQIILIGATTENPSFKLNGALLSRCRVFQLKSLSDSEIVKIATRAAKLKQSDAGLQSVDLDNGVVPYIASVSNGDARAAISLVDLAFSAIGDYGTISVEDVQNALQRTHVTYGAEEHYDLISALHKSLRGSDDNAALYWLGRMLQGGEDPLYIARRMVRFASEDIGLADNSALPLAVAAYQACQNIGMPECDTVLAHCATYLARAPKSVETYKAFNRVKETLKTENPWPVPLHLRNAPTQMMKNLGYSAGYKYNPDYDGPVDQIYLPDNMNSRNFFVDSMQNTSTNAQL